MRANPPRLFCRKSLKRLGILPEVEYIVFVEWSPVILPFLASANRIVNCWLLRDRDYTMLSSLSPAINAERFTLVLILCAGRLVARIGRATPIHITVRVSDHTRSDSETTLGIARFSGAQTRPKSEKPQISHHPGSPCNKKSQAEFGPVQMRFWVGDQAGNPNQDAKECQHDGHQA